MAAACETTFWEVPEGAKRTDRLQLTCSSSCCCRFVVGLLSVDVVAICSVQGCGKNDMFVQVQVNNKAGWECIIWKFACLFDHTDWGELLVQLTPFCAVVTWVSFELHFGSLWQDRRGKLVCKLFTLKRTIYSAHPARFLNSVLVCFYQPAANPHDSRHGSGNTSQTKATSGKSRHRHCFNQGWPSSAALLSLLSVVRGQCFTLQH